MKIKLPLPPAAISGPRIAGGNLMDITLNLRMLEQALKLIRKETWRCF